MLVCGVFSLMQMPAFALPETSQLHGSVERIDSADWQISALEYGVELAADRMRGVIRIGRLSLPSADIELLDTRIVCTDLSQQGAAIICRAALLHADFPGAGRHTVAGSITYQRDSGDLRFQLRELPLAGGHLTLEGEVTAGTLHVEFKSTSLQLDRLLEVAATFGVEAGDVTATGGVQLTGRIDSGNEQVLTVAAELTDLALSNDSGTVVSDSLDGRFELTARASAAGYRFDLRASANKGEVYIEPVYANLGNHALRIEIENGSTSDLTELRLPAFRIEQDSLFAIKGNVQLVLPATDRPASVSGEIELQDSDLATLYASGLQIAAAGTILGELETAGRVSGTFSLQDNEPRSARLTLVDVAIDDTRRRFAVYGLNGQVNWPGPDGGLSDAPPSRLRFDSATAYNIVLEGAEMQARIGGDDVELLAPLRLPTMGGALLINRLLMNDYGTENASGLLDAELLPIQLGQLSGAFGWPAFSGSLSGRLPLLQYEGNAMTVGGTLAAQAFDGEISVSNLRLEQPFGRVPRLTADLRLRNLDLQRVTDTFSFGLIQGRLSGDATGLEMVAWKPVAMDLHLYTPPDDRSRHRISQRAVEDLTSIGGGGGAAAVLSSGFLKFFEVFAYDKIGLRCVLRAGNCTMSGAGPAGEGPLGSGYYIVKGSGVPRIDVVGYRREVNWERLLRQLGQISGTAVVN
jgi:hypothetical protein